MIGAMPGGSGQFRQDKEDFMPASVALPYDTEALSRPNHPGVWVGVGKLIRERLQVVVVQTEPPREGTRGHAATSMPHGQRLVPHLLEGHALPLSMPWGSSQYML